MRDTIVMMGAILRGSVRRTMLWAALFVAAGATGELRAQNLISVPFTTGFIGARGSSAGTANTVKTYQTLGIARTFFIQNSSTNLFELQGNDIPGTLRIVRTDGTTLDIPASANWRNSGGTTHLIGILPRPASPITFTYATGSIQITDGASPGGSSVGGYVAAYSGTTLADGESTSGNAAQSQVLSGLNSYLSTVMASRPAGPVTVSALRTSNAQPTITGTAALPGGENLSVVVGGVQYTTTSAPAVVRSGANWSLALTSSLPVGTHSVTATITNSDGFTLDDPSLDEVVITSSGGTVTLGGSLTADDKMYDGTTAATGTTSGLTLVGLEASDQVTIAGVTLAFQSAGAAPGKTVAITGVTLGGADATLYTVDLTGAPAATASITARPVTVTGVAVANKPYDGTPTAVITGSPNYAGLVAGETYSVGGTPMASFDAPGVGTGKPVTVTGYTAPSANYTITLPTGLTADITARALTIGGSFTAADRSYDGTAAASITTSALTPAGVVAGESVSLTGVTAGFADAAVGQGKSVSLVAASLAGPGASNYTLNLAGAPAATASITPRVVTIGGSFAAADKVFDGTTGVTITENALVLVGALPGESVSLTGVTAAFADADVGVGKPVRLTSADLAGAAAGHYSLDLAGAPTTAARILPASPPSAPRSMAATAGDRRLTVTWTAPELEGCSAISGYLLEYSAGDGAAWTRLQVAPATPMGAVLPGLVNNTEHRVRVAAVNACGTGAFAAAQGPLVPIGPTLGGTGHPVTSAPGTASVITDGASRPAATEVVQDTILRLVGGDFALRLHTTDHSGAAIPVDSARTLWLEHGGRAAADGSGFAPGTFVTLYLLAATGEPMLLGTVPVRSDGSFSAQVSIDAAVPPGYYTLQVNGVDHKSLPRGVAVGVGVTPPLSDLVLTATADEPSPAVGDTIIVTITVTNEGRGPAIDAVIPRAFREPGFVVLRTDPLEGTYDPTHEKWTIPRIEPGARARMLLTVVIHPPAEREISPP